MSVLEEERGKGRDDYPVRAIWNSILAGVVYEHKSVQSLRRELKRNGQLRELCGFDVEKGLKAVPRSWAYSRFLKNLSIITMKSGVWILALIKKSTPPIKIHFRS